MTDKFITLNFVIDGKTYPVTQNENSPLKAAVQKALDDANVVTPPIDKWYGTWENEKLDFNNKIKDYNFPEGAIIKLFQEPGMGGCSYGTIC